MSDFCDVTRSDYLQQHLAEREAVSVHKWHLSEKAGHDVGWEYANWSWVMHGHRARWRTTYQQSGISH